jgi:hypothetical protein
VIAALKNFIKATPLAKPFIFLKGKATRPRTQNEEGMILRTILSRFDIPKRFIEFGFGGWEFTCAELAAEWEGLLIDGDPYNVTIARIILPSRITAWQRWLTLETMGEIRKWCAGRELGILSVDVDGNDYWFLQALIDLKPALIVAEYNSSFGLRPISVPYDPEFDYVVKHPSRYYHGASLTALAHLAGIHGYSLIEVGASGVNAFFIRSDLLERDDIPLDPAHAYREKFWWNGTRTSEQWEQIMHLPFVDVTQDARTWTSGKP